MKNGKQMMQAPAAIVRGRDLPMSVKQAMLLCRVLEGQRIDPSLKLLEQIQKQEIGVRVNQGVVKKSKAGVKYPIKASGVFIKLLKSLNANANVKKVDPSTLVIHARADKATRPQRPGAQYMKFKRCHITVEGIAKVKKEGAKKDAGKKESEKKQEMKK